MQVYMFLAKVSTFTLPLQVPSISPFKTAILGQTDGKTNGGAVHSAVQTQTAVLFEGMI